MAHFYSIVPDQLRRLSIGAVIDRYEAGGDEPGLVIEGLSREQCNAHPVPGTWSIQQILCHLMDTDQVAAYRMKRIIAEDRPTWDLYDENAFAAKLDYERRDPVAVCQVFRLNRELMAALLRGLPRSAFDRVATHQEVGEIRLDDFLRLYTHHLEHHLRFARQKREMVAEAR